MFAEVFMGEAEKRTHTVHHMPEARVYSLMDVFELPKFLPSSNQSHLFSSSSVHCINMVFLSLSACFPTRQKEKQNTAKKLKVAYFLYVEEI